MVGRISKKTWLIGAIVIVAVVVPVAIAISNNSSNPSDSTPQSEEAPDFTLPTMTGANVTLSDLKGTPVVVNFWSISCSWCRKQLPYLESVAQQSEGQATVIAVNSIDNAASLQNFFGDYEPTMMVAMDYDKTVFANYCVAYNNTRAAIPFTLFVDTEGTVQYVRIGAFASEEALWNTLNDILGITIP